MEKIVMKNGIMNIDIAKLRFESGEYEAVNLCLDEKGVPREVNGKELSLWGRICYSHQCQRVNDTEV